jgi:hypothetical protein
VDIEKFSATKLNGSDSKDFPLLALLFAFLAAEGLRDGSSRRLPVRVALPNGKATGNHARGSR